jgi:PAS domain S-box-containing protein
LLQERRHLRAILQMLAPGALEVDGDGRIVWANPGACASFGRTEATFVGEFFASLAPPESRPRLQALLADLMRSGEGVPLATPLVLEARAVSVRLMPIVEDQTCTGLLILLEGQATIA